MTTTTNGDVDDDDNETDNGCVYITHTTTITTTKTHAHHTHTHTLHIENCIIAALALQSVSKVWALFVHERPSYWTYIIYIKCTHLSHQTGTWFDINHCVFDHQCHVIIQMRHSACRALCCCRFLYCLCCCCWCSFVYVGSVPVMHYTRFAVHGLRAVCSVCIIVLYDTSVFMILTERRRSHPISPTRPRKQMHTENIYVLHTERDRETERQKPEQTYYYHIIG